MESNLGTKSSDQSSRASSEVKNRRKPSLLPLRNSAKRKNSYDEEDDLIVHSRKSSATSSGCYFENCSKHSSQSETECQFGSPPQPQQTRSSSSNKRSSGHKQFVINTPYIPFVHQPLMRTAWQSEEIIPEEKDEIERKQTQLAYERQLELETPSDDRKCTEAELQPLPNVNMLPTKPVLMSRGKQIDSSMARNQNYFEIIPSFEITIHQAKTSEVFIGKHAAEFVDSTSTQCIEMKPIQQEVLTYDCQSRSIPLEIYSQRQAEHQPRPHNFAIAPNVVVLKMNPNIEHHESSMQTDLPGLRMLPQDSMSISIHNCPPVEVQKYLSTRIQSFYELLEIKYREQLNQIKHNNHQSAQYLRSYQTQAFRDEGSQCDPQPFRPSLKRGLILQDNRDQVQIETNPSGKQDLSNRFKENRSLQSDWDAPDSQLSNEDANDNYEPREYKKRKSKTPSRRKKGRK